MQGPGDDASAQLRQAPVQALSQHRPSTQKPDTHSLRVVTELTDRASGRRCVDAGDAVVAIGVGLAARRARAVGASGTVAILDARRAAGAQAVAGPGRVQLVPGAARLVHACRAGTWRSHRSRRTARSDRRRRAGVAAQAVRIGLALIDGPAGPFAARQRARHARPIAGDVAADAVGAEAADAVRRLLALRALHAAAAAPCSHCRPLTHWVLRSTCRSRPRWRVTRRRHADDGRARLAAARAVARRTGPRPRRLRRLPALHSVPADVLSAAASAVALAVQAAGAGGSGHTRVGGARLPARPRCRRICPRFPGARHAAFGAGGVAADAVDAEAAARTIGRAARRPAPLVFGRRSRPGTWGPTFGGAAVGAHVRADLHRRGRASASELASAASERIGPGVPATKTRRQRATREPASSAPARPHPERPPLTTEHASFSWRRTPFLD